MPKAGRDVLPQVGSLVEGPARLRAPVRAGQPRPLRRQRRRRGGPLGGGRRDRVDRARRALEVVGLGEVGRRPVRAYSLGMRQRLGLAAAMLRQPELLVLDEPTNGLDPQGIREIRTLLQQLHAAGTTIFLSSHLLAEVDQLCTRVGLLDRGRLVIQESLAALRAPDRADRRARRRTSRSRRRSWDGRGRGGGRRPARRPVGRPGRVNARLVAGRRRGARARPRAAQPGAGHRGAHLAPGVPGRSPDDPGRAGQAVRAAPHVGGDRRCSTCCRPWSACCWRGPGSRPRPGQGPAFLSAVIANGSLFADRRAGHRAAAVPADRGRRRRGGRGGRRGAGRHPALPPGPPGRPDPAARGQAGRRRRCSSSSGS